MEQLPDARRERVGEATARARSLAAFYASGGLLNIASCLVPGWHASSRPGLLAIAAVALATAAGLYLAGGRVSGRLCLVLLAAGSGLIGGCIVSAGATPMALAYAFFFCWVSVYAANWWSVRALTANLVLAALCEAGAITAVGLRDLVLPACLVSMGACTAAGLVVHRLKAQVRELAMRDPLTGALNRRGLIQTLSARRRARTSWTVVALDLDGFKAFNDSQGHAQGDSVLRTCVAAWSALLAPGEACARLGGDEFVLLCSRPADAVIALIALVRDSVPQPLSISVGTATTDFDEPVSDVFARADAALYLDKRMAADDHIPQQRGGLRLASRPAARVRA